MNCDKTVGGARTWAGEIFRKARVESPALTADLLLGHVLGWDRVLVLSHSETVLTEEAWQSYRSMVQRRAAGEPLQYIAGECEFFGLKFRVSPDVLIPRPETEILVESAVKRARSRPISQLRFLDVGTGSGCIAVSVAHGIPASAGWAVDISESALAVARDNASRNGVLKRISFIRADLLECFPAKPYFNLILSNPPYVAGEEYDSLPSVVRDHEPPGALLGGASGLEIYRRLIPEASSRLVPEGCLIMELGIGQSTQIARLAEEAGFKVVEIINDLQGIPRCLVGLKLFRRENG